MQKYLPAALLAAQLAFLALPSQAQVTYYQPEHQGFFHRHPYAAAAGLGALTGGIGSFFLGGTLLHGAAVGAGTHSGFHFLRKHYEAYRYRNSRLY